MIAETTTITLTDKEWLTVIQALDITVWGRKQYNPDTAAQPLALRARVWAALNGQEDPK